MKNRENQERIAITGSSGFVGSAILEQCKKHKVLRIPHEWLLDPELLTNKLTKFNPTIIIHLATAGNMYMRDFNDHIFIYNVFGTYNLLRAIQDIPYKTFINFSSSSVQLEEMTMYAATKLSVEHIITAIVNEYHKPIIIIRPSSITGVGDQSEHLIPKLISSALTGEQMMFIPKPVHDFIDISDLVRAVLILSDMPDCAGKVINVSSGQSYTNEEVYDIVEEVVGKAPNVKIVDSMRVYDSITWYVDNSEMLKFGWRPLVSLEQSIRNMYEARNR